MLHASTKFLGVAVLTTLCALALATAAHAGDPLKCKKTIEANVSAYAQAKMKVLQKCNAGIVSGKTSGPCPDTNGALKIAKVETKIRAGIGKACGGSTKHCTDGDALPLATYVWDLSTCPNLENGICNNALANCDDVSDCVICVAGAAADQAMSLYYDDLVAGQFGTGSTVNKCQLAIAKNAYKFLAVKNKVLTKCEATVLTGAIPGPCPDATRALPAINAAESKKQIGICKACGGANRVCGGGDDLTPAAIGFAANCPSVTIPGGSACGGAITNLQDIVNCVDCVDEFKADCLDFLSVPALKSPYPAECNPPTAPPCDATPQNTATPCPTSTPGIMCPTQVMTEVNGSAVDLDTGWTGMGHDAHMPSQNRLTLGVSLCSNPDSSTCGVCATSGPLPNAGGAAFNTQRCVLDTSVQCTSDGDCGGNAPCSFFFGSPLPLAAGGITFCVTNQITAPVTGTVDVEGGTTSTTIQLLSSVYTSPTLNKPCPTCESGVCHGGLHDGATCVVNGTSPPFGAVSFDCPPNPGANVGKVSTTRNYSTGTQTVSLSATNPNCRDPVFSGDKCFCDTCNNLAGTLCSSNADCVLVGATVCGGKRCLGGVNPGAPCANNSECPGTGGGCGVAGEATRPNACNDGTCSSTMTCVGGCNNFLDCTGAFKCVGGGNDAALCTVDSECPGGACNDQCPGGACVAGNEGTCAAGPVEQFCTPQETFRGCATNADCPHTGDTCTLRKFRDCFLDNGGISGSVAVSGTSYPTCGNVGSGTVGALFCVPPVAANLVNNDFGLPGLSRITQPYTATFN
jgi:hypothetical protein